jgi:sulfatase maturation enzyme AslB (radical SAM superfamily)
MRRCLTVASREALGVLAPSPAVLWMATGSILLYLDTLRRSPVLAIGRLHPGDRARFRLPVAVPRRTTDQGSPVMPTITLGDPLRYFEAITASRHDIAEAPPVCLYLEITNRCNLLCETCHRTFEDLEPPPDMSWDLFTRIVDQVPAVARVVLHGVGEPMLVKTLPRMIRYLKDRGTYVLFNTNGTLLNPKKFPELLDTGLDELHVPLDAADRKSYTAIRGKDCFPRIVRDVKKFTLYQRQMGSLNPRVSLWLPGLKETVEQLPEFVRLAASMGVNEVYLQRLAFDESGFGKARP